MNTDTISSHFTGQDDVHIFSNGDGTYLFSNGDKLDCQKKSLILTFAGKRNTLSTSAFQGGYREDFTCVFNFDEKPEHGNQCEMRAATYEEHLRQIARQELSLNPSLCTGLSTAADMKNTVIETMTHITTHSTQNSDSDEASDTIPPLTVTAVVTGGIDKNGARAGDPACWTEQNGSYLPVPGTINIFLHINANLSKGAMARALVTCTEAKTVAVTELFCPSLYSTGLATGSGTDGIILICAPESPLLLTAAGKDSMLGEMIAKTVIPAVKKAIGLQTDVTPNSQHHALRRLERFGLTEDKLYEAYLHHFSLEKCLKKSLKKASEQNPTEFSKRNQKKAPEKEISSLSEALSKEAFLHIANPLLASGYWTGKASLLAHLLDQIQWEMLPYDEVYELVLTLFPCRTLSIHEFTEEKTYDMEQALHLFCEEFLLAFQ